MRGIFRVMFYLRSNYVNKSGKASVMIRIYLDGERTSLGASVFCSSRTMREQEQQG
ncbi:Arm DNA-binding domain-containing protein [Porphyromonas sp. COT-290 OH860]|uniref:Arm DNA-binding domain-containing protein n=1 Tax=Porphyromonas sp. COT-290 OH860 TaxID=1515615 RepID=UPI0013779430